MCHPNYSTNSNWTINSEPQIVTKHHIKISNKMMSAISVKSPTSLSIKWNVFPLLMSLYEGWGTTDKVRMISSEWKEFLCFKSFCWNGEKIIFQFFLFFFHSKTLRSDSFHIWIKIFFFRLNFVRCHLSLWLNCLTFEWNSTNWHNFTWNSDEFSAPSASWKLHKSCFRSLANVINITHSPAKMLATQAMKWVAKINSMYKVQNKMV